MKYRICFILLIGLCSLPLSYAQTKTNTRQPFIPVLKDGSSAAYVMFTRPKQPQGLALVVPEGNSVEREVFMGHYGAKPSENSSDKYLYFQAAKDQLVTATGTFYVSIQYSDKGQGAIELEYMQSTDEGNVEVQSEHIFLRNSSLWQEHTFKLTNAVLNKDFPGNSDFRIHCPGIALQAVMLSRIQLTFPKTTLKQMFRQPDIVPPAGYDFGIYLNESQQSDIWEENSNIGQKIKLYNAWGARYIVETIDAGLLPREISGFDFSLYASHSKKLAYSNLAWIPRIKIGDLHKLPKDMAAKLQKAASTLRNSPGPMASLWDPRLPDIYYDMMQDLRQDVFMKRVPMLILSFAGDWGPLYLSTESSTSEGWPDLWAGDPLALQKFRSFVQSKYGNLRSLSVAWRTSITNWNEVKPDISDNAIPWQRNDTMMWYKNALIQLAAEIIQKAQSLFTGTRIVLEIGDEIYYSATDLDAFAELAALRGCSILMVSKSANPTSSYSWQLLSSSCRFEGVPFGLRLNKRVYEENLLSAIYSLASERGTMFFFHEEDLTGENAWESYARSVSRLHLTQPDKRIALIYPKTSVNAEDPETFDRYVRELRELFAFDVIDETRLGEITTSQYPLIYIPWGHYWSQQAVSTLKKLVRSGSGMVVRTEAPWETQSGNVEFNEELFATKLVRQGDSWVLEPRTNDPSLQSDTDPYTAANRRIVNLGSQNDAPYLSGKWSPAQSSEDAKRYGFDFFSFRWMSDRAEVKLPVLPRRNYKLIVEGYLPEKKNSRVFVNGRQFAEITGSGRFQWEKELDGRWKPRQKDVEVTFQGQTWNPGAVLGATQTFQVSMAISRVALIPPDEELNETESTSVNLRNPDFSRELLRGSWMREVGKGVTLLAPARFIDNWLFTELLNTLAMNPKILDPRFSFSLPPDGERNQMFVSPQSGSDVYLNLSQRRVQVINRQQNYRRIIPPRSIYYTN